MTLLLKDPDAALDYAVDWGAQYLGSERLISSSWTVEPEEVAGVTVLASRFDGQVATVTAAGGAQGGVYRMTNHVVLASGQSDSRTIVLRVEKR